MECGRVEQGVWSVGGLSMVCGVWDEVGPCLCEVSQRQGVRGVVSPHSSEFHEKSLSQQMY